METMKKLLITILIILFSACVKESLQPSDTKIPEICLINGTWKTGFEMPKNNWNHLTMWISQQPHDILGGQVRDSSTVHDYLVWLDNTSKIIGDTVILHWPSGFDTLSFKGVINSDCNIITGQYYGQVFRDDIYKGKWIAFKTSNLP
jgi:hypothetical protein